MIKVPSLVILLGALAVAVINELHQAGRALYRSPATDNLPTRINPYAPISMEDPNSFAACLQIMDDNHFLIEWLSYNYHVMPLRRLIVLVDPKSRTTPLPILERWKGRMNITLWNDDNVFEGGKPPAEVFQPGVPEVRLHRLRQATFNAKCLKTLKREGRGWVLIADTDEYTMVNPRVRNPDDPIFHLQNLGRLEVPGPDDGGSIFALLQQNVSFHIGGQQAWKNPCVPLPRKQFSPREFQGKRIIPAHVYAKNLGFNVSHFQTLRWRHWGKGPLENGAIVGKSMIDLNRVMLQEIPPTSNPHIPIPNLCTQYGKWVDEKHSPFVINHYSGTLEQILFRQNDQRFSQNGTTGRAYRVERYKDDATFGHHTEPTAIQSWLQGFVQSVGLETARELLHAVGQPEEATTLSLEDLYTASAKHVNIGAMA